jgi:hypothetical protein
MLDEQNNNLQPVDGSEEITSNNLDNQSIEANNDQIAENFQDENTTDVNQTDEIIHEKSETVEVSDFVNVEVPDEIISKIDEANAEEHEDENLKSRHDINEKDYHQLSMDLLLVELESLLEKNNVTAVKRHVDEVTNEFNAKYQHFIDEKKTEWESQENASDEVFSYHFPLKDKFDLLLKKYRSDLNNYRNKQENNLKANLANREALVEELKNLLTPNESIKDIFQQLNEIKEKWRNAGSIPKDKYNTVWNNYHFHMERFYDFIHLDREARDADFKNNLEHKLNIIEQAESLVDEPNVMKAFRELQVLHRVWKEEIGPVSREHRKEIWDKFSNITKVIHDRKEELNKVSIEREKENLEVKLEIVSQIETLANENSASHNVLQNAIKKVEQLREVFFLAGRVPHEDMDMIWGKFKAALKAFNVKKNEFYKNLKNDQFENLNKKNELLKLANENKDSEDFVKATELFKDIQNQWKDIGHVPRHLSDKIWKEFQEACNHYFNRLKDSKKSFNEEEVKSFEQKKEYLDRLRTFEMSGDYQTDLANIKTHIENWKNLGKVPFSRRHIEGKFNKVLDGLFAKLSESRKEANMLRFQNKFENLDSNEADRKMRNEKTFLTRKIEEVKQEISQLENNMLFFSKSNQESPLLKEVHKNLEKQKSDLADLEERLKQLNILANKKDNNEKSSVESIETE